MVKGIRNDPYIEVYYTHFTVHNYNTKKNILWNDILKRLSVWDGLYKKYSMHAFKLDEDKNELRIPMGISIDNIVNILSNDYGGREIKVIDHRPERKTAEDFGLNEPFKVKFEPKDEVQVNALKFLGKFDTKFSNDISGQLFLDLDTGMGKTYVATKYVNESRRIPMIFVGSTQLAEQWIERIQDYTHLKPENIAFISGKDEVARYMKKKRSELKKIRYFIVMIKTADNLTEEQLNDFYDKLRIGLRVFDEAHLNLKSIIELDMVSNIPTLYLTATTSRSDYAENRIYRTVFADATKFMQTKIAKDSKVKAGLDNKYQNILILKYNSNPDPIQIANLNKISARVGKGFNIVAYSKYLLDDKKELFYKTINDITAKVSGNGSRRTVVLLNRKSAIDEMVEYMNETFGKENNRRIMPYHSDISKKNKEITLETADIIISTEKSLGTGSDIPGLQVMVNTVSTRSATLVTQMVGRLRKLKDKETLYVDIADSGFPQLESQLKARMTVYNKLAKSIKIVK